MRAPGRRIPWTQCGRRGSVRAIGERGNFLLKTRISALCNVSLWPWDTRPLLAAQLRSVFEDAAKAANLGNNATPAQVIQGLYDLRGDTLQGMAPPLTFTKNTPTTGIDCAFHGLQEQHSAATAPWPRTGGPSQR